MAYVRGVPAFGQQHPADTAGSAGPRSCPRCGAGALYHRLFLCGACYAGAGTHGFGHRPPRRARSVLRRQEHYRNLRFQRGNTCTWSRTGLLSGTGAGLYRLSYHRYCQPVAYCGGCRSACFGKRDPGKIHLQNAPGGYSAPSARPCLPSIAFLLHHRRADWRLCFSVPFRV